ncbi:hypothetical protein KP509_19G071600 [Ceratopteris richardii]|uniref:AAA+ ATPase domain-containing protein n=1 Tax=Ceratopteris richardii TaxID=49495 RepID=A0A8T2SN39_CERRI|nr:hypothetical protein KP509_19G071600 [Ceratopteris richardii]
MEVMMSQLLNLMGFFALLQTLIPPPLRKYIDQGLRMLWGKLFPGEDPCMEIEVEERVVHGYTTNKLYRQVGVYLGSLRSSLNKQARLRVCRSVEGGPLSFSLHDNESIDDNFEGVQVSWTHSVKEKESPENSHRYSNPTQRSFILRFRKTDRAVILPAYLDHISDAAAAIERKNARRYLYTNNNDSWEETPFNHPSTFDTLALDPGMGERIKADLDAFSKGESFYHRNGRAWKRGYLLYGPPGTGKSSLIAAIANYMQFDIYDLELTKVSNNADLKSLLMQTTRKSVIVIEDIDCSVKLSNRDGADEASEKATDSNTSCKLTLSGLLNFTDGLWSCCGEERIFIFTTNFKERIDLALLRPGRMDMHILLSYCTFHAFKKLARNYLGIQEHPMYLELDEAMRKTSIQLTPAAIAEILISNQDSPDVAIREVLAAFPKDMPNERAGNVDGGKCQLSHNESKQQTFRQTMFVFFQKTKHLR